MARKHGELSREEYEELASGNAHDFALYLFVPGDEEKVMHQAVVFGPKGHMEEGWEETGVYGEYEVCVLAQTGGKGILSRRPLETRDMLALIRWLGQAIGHIHVVQDDEASHGAQG